jgi:hypothetical protein
LVDLGLVTLPSSNGSWPAYHSYLPDKKNVDDVIAVYDSAAVDQGRTADGESQQFYGIQISLRSDDIDEATFKGRTILRAIDRQTHNRTVIVNGFTYLIHDMTTSGDLVNAGVENPTTRRRLFTINAIVALTMTSTPGTGTGTGTGTS